MSSLFDIYTKGSCPFCTRTKKLLQEKGLAYAEYVIGVDVTREEIKEKFPAMRTVPIIVKDGQLIGGYVELCDHLNPKEL